MILFLSVVSILGLCSSSYGTIYWTDAVGDGLWSSPGNWDTGTVPPEDCYQEVENVQLGDWGGVPVAGATITEGVSAYAMRLRGPGYNGTGPQTLIVDGGYLRVDRYWRIGYGGDPNLNAVADFYDGQIEVWITYAIYCNNNSVFNMYGGTLYSGFYIPSGYSQTDPNLPSAVVNIYDGLVDTHWQPQMVQCDGVTPTRGDHPIRMGHATKPGGRLNLYGGEVHTSSLVFNINPVRQAVIDIHDGILVIDSNVVQDIQGHDANGRMISYNGEGDGVLATYDPCSNTTTVIGLPDMTYAYWPSPKNNATDVPPTVELTWYPGEGAKAIGGQAVYLGTAFSDVNDAVAPIVTQDGNSWDPPGELLLGQTYFCRIDTIGDSETWKGKIWSFTVDDGSAKNPDPADEAKNVELTKTLTWTPGLYAASHDVYFGTDESPPYVTTKSLGDESYPVSLNYGEKYYWKIVEVNNTYVGNSPGPWEGPVWSFEAEPFKVIDDFEDYADSSALRANWDDYYADNTNGVAVTVITDKTQARNSTQAMLYDWIATGYDYMAATLNLPGPENWTTGDLKTLTLYFYGDPCNVFLGFDHDLCVELSDGTKTSTQVYGDINDISVAEWQEWNILLQDFVDDNDVNLLNVTSLALQIKNLATGNGVIRVDDIRLYPSKCVPAKSSLKGDTNDDCIVNYLDVYVMKNDWLVTDTNAPAEALPSPVSHWALDEISGTDVPDSSGNSNDGTLVGDPQWVTGTIGGALDFDGDGDYITVPDDNNHCDSNDGSFSIAMWVNTIPAPRFDGGAGSFGLFHKEDAVTDAGVRIHYHTSFLHAEFRFYVSDSDSTETLILPRIALPPAEWAHMTFIRDAVANKLDAYVDGLLKGTYQLSAIGSVAAASSTPVLIGNNTTGGYLDGMLDDIQVFKAALTQGQIATLMGVGGIYVANDSPADVYAEAVGSGIVNLKDYSIVAGEWLQKSYWP
jgi:hypothetical protein